MVRTQGKITAAIRAAPYSPTSFVVSVYLGKASAAVRG